MSGSISVERDGPVAKVLLDRPERKNAFNHAMWGALGAAADELAAQLPRAVVITGAGDAFCAGQDVNPDNPQVSGLMAGVRDRDRAPVDAMLRQMHDALDRFFALPVPLIAALNGLAYGGGAEFATRCDMRLLDPSAVMCFSEVRLGLMPDWGGGVALTRLVGPARAAELVLTAKKIDAQRAAAIGLANTVTATGAAADEAMVWAREIAANGPQAVRLALRVIRETPDMPMNAAIAHEVDLAAELIATGECVHGITAFMTRTAPSFPDPE
jgi:enoyl-CoA hydratase/carnithine racemase